MIGINSKKNLMATSFEMEMYSEEHQILSLKSIAESAFDLAQKIENELSEFIPSSPVFLFNQAQCGEKIVFSDHTKKCFLLSKKIADESHHAFNPCFRSGRTLDDLSFQDLSFWKNHPSCTLSFGAIGKGYALDQMKLLLLQNGMEHFRISAGGSSHLFHGLKNGKTSWPVSWSWMKNDEDEYFGIELEAFEVKNTFSIGVSGRMEKGNHILSLHPNTLSSVWVEHPSAAHSDAWSTAYFASASLRDQALLPCSWIDQDQTFFANQNFLKRWGQKSE